MLRTGLVLLVAALVLTCGAAPVFAHDVIYDFPLDSYPGWTAGGGWEFGAADTCGGLWPCSAPSGGWGPHTGSYLYGHRLSGGTTGLPAAESLTTTMLNCTGWENVTLSFWRKLGVSQYTAASVEVSNNGSSWATVWSSGAAKVDDADWTLCTYDLSAVADDRPTVYVRWSIGPTTNDLCFCYGFDIDDIQLTGDHLPPNDLVYNFPLSYNPGWTMTGGWEWGSDSDCCTGGPSTGATWFKHVSESTPGAGDGYYGIYVTDTLTTSATDCTGLTDVHVSFWRMLGLANRYGPDDEASLQVSNNGTTWTTVWQTRAWFVDGGWTYCEYDISAVADDQPTVYVRWVMGPTDDACGCYGWDIDDVQITAKSSQPPLQILAWVPYADASREYPNTVAALSGLGEPYVVTESYTSDPATLAAELEGKQVFLVPEPESADTADLTTAGEAFAGVLQDFAYDGGTVVVCGEHQDVTNHTGFMTATGLMIADYVGVTFDTVQGLTTVLPAEPISDSLAGIFGTSNATASYAIGPESTAVVEDASGNAVFAYRDYGYGAAVMVGFDYYASNANAAQVLVNAVRYPRWNREVLLYRRDAITDNSLEALNRLHLRYRLGCTGGGMDCAFGYPWYWNPIVYDSPMWWISVDGAGIVDYIANGGKAMASTWDLTDETTVAAAFGVTAVENLISNPPVYRWDPTNPVFTDPMAVPDLLTWSDDWPSNGDRLSVTGPDGVALAGLTASSAADQAAVVRANGGRTIVNGFLWDEKSGDSDGDGIDDVVELIMDEVITLARTPEADFVADWLGTHGPLPVTFTDGSQGFIDSWSWDFGDGGASIEQNPIHTYTSSGSFTVSLTVSNRYGEDTETELDLIVVTDIPPVADFEGSPTSGATPLEVAFSDLSVNDPTEWAWDFGDTGTSDVQNPTHTYTDAGSYTVSLTATNAAGSNTEIKSDYITAASPVAAAFSASTTAGTVPLAVTFTDQSTGSPTEWEWDFGDGATSTEQNPSHTYGDPGYYTVTLAASNGVVADVEERPGCIAAGFIDTPTDNWAFYYILACATAEVVQGYWDNSYKPTDPVNRGQMAVYIARALAGGEGSVPDPSVTEPSFTDVTADHWAYRYVEYVKEQEVVQGYPDGSYQPDAVVNRGQMAVYIARATVDVGERPDLPSYTAPTEATFPDVTAENAWSWCHKYVEYIATLAPPVTTGYPDGMYHPEREVTRDQMAVYVQRAFDLPMYLPSS